MTCSKGDFGLYVHWPFCKAKCPYCDFNSHVRHEPVDHQLFVRSLNSEMTYAAAHADKRPLTSIFFGGGTPSLMPPTAVAEIIEAAQRTFGLAPDVEITLEANPTSVEAGHFRGYRSAGVNRVSVGVQALDGAALTALGRQHSPAEAIAAFRLASQIFPRCSFDMIYARPHQTVVQWRQELALALAEQQGHMSLYQLTIEPGTRYFDLAERGALNVPGEDDALALYEVTQEMTEAAGLNAYEVSNHALPGHESRHNQLYWRYGPYIGIGPGAHGRIAKGNTVTATVAEKHPETWANLVSAQGHGLTEQADVPIADQAQEYLLMGLRLSEGIDINRYEALTGHKPPLQKIADLQRLGMITEIKDNRLIATQRGRQVLNTLITELALAQET